MYVYNAICIYLILLCCQSLNDAYHYKTLSDCKKFLRIPNTLSRSLTSKSGDLTQNFICILMFLSISPTNWIRSPIKPSKLGSNSIDAFNLCSLLIGDTTSIQRSSMFTCPILYNNIITQYALYSKRCFQGRNSILHYMGVVKFFLVILARAIARAHPHTRPKGFARAILSVQLTCEICYYTCKCAMYRTPSNLFIDKTGKGYFSK